MKVLHTHISATVSSIIMKIALDKRDLSQFLVQKISNKTDLKLRRKLNFTVKIWSTFALMKNQVYNIFRKNSSLRPNVNLIKII
jgi:predicted P-loop ATPase